MCNHLSSEGHEVTSHSTGLEGLRSATTETPDLLVLDLGLPDLEGLDLLKMIRSVTSSPVLVLTAREEEDVILSAFREGADDYVVKPVSGPQLSARVSALLRRGASNSLEVLRVGNLEVHLGPRIVKIAERTLDLTAKEFDVISYLAARPGVVISKEELHAAVWKSPMGTAGRTVDVHISTLRKKFGEKPDDSNHYIHTVIGAGVRIQDPGS